MRKIINHHIERGTRESHPRVQDLQHPRLGKPRRGLQILDTWMGFPRPSLNAVLDSVILTLETGISANFDVRRNVVPPWRVRQAHSGSNSPMTSQNVNAKQSRKVASRVHFKHILHIFRQEWEKLSNTALREGLGQPRRGLKILDTRKGVFRPSLNVVLDSIKLLRFKYYREG